MGLCVKVKTHSAGDCREFYIDEANISHGAQPPRLSRASVNRQGVLRNNFSANKQLKPHVGDLPATTYRGGREVLGYA